jgi:hypothetical protein
MSGRAWTKLEKISAALVCIAVLVSLVAAYLQSLQTERNVALQGVGISGLLVALAIVAIFLVQAVSVTGTLLIVAFAVCCFYLSVLFPLLKRYPFRGIAVVVIGAILSQRDKLKNFDTIAWKFISTALQGKRVSQHEDASNRKP